MKAGNQTAPIHMQLAATGYHNLTRHSSQPHGFLSNLHPARICGPVCLRSRIPYTMREVPYDRAPMKSPIPCWGIRQSSMCPPSKCNFLDFYDSNLSMTLQPPLLNPCGPLKRPSLGNPSPQPGTTHNPSWRSGPSLGTLVALGVLIFWKIPYKPW